MRAGFTKRYQPTLGAGCFQMPDVRQGGIFHFAASTLPQTVYLSASPQAGGGNRLVSVFAAIGLPDSCRLSVARTIFGEVFLRLSS